MDLFRLLGLFDTLPGYRRRFGRCAAGVLGAGVFLTVACSLVTQKGTVDQTAAPTGAADSNATPLPSGLDGVLATITDIDNGKWKWDFIPAIAQAFREERFADLETAATRLRAVPLVRFADGSPALEVFYVALLPSAEQLADETMWTEWRTRCQKWAKAFPASPTPPVVEAKALVARAWSKRGTGWARDVTPEGWDGFRKDLASARELLEKAPVTCPERWDTLLGVALGQNWNSDDYETLFNEAVSRWPDYDPFYAHKAVYLLPRWYGSSGEIAAWAEAEVKSGRSGLGEAIYAIIVFGVVEYPPFAAESLVNEGFDWPTLRAGLRAVIAATPKSNYNAHLAAKLAWSFDDAEAAREFLLPVQGRQPWGGVTTGQLAQIERWCGLAEPAGRVLSLRPHATYKTDPAREGLVLALLVIPEPLRLLAGDLGGTVTALTIPELKPGKTLQHPSSAGSLALSPDGRRFAVAGCDPVSQILEFDAAALAPTRPPLNASGPLTEFAYRDATSWIGAFGSYNEDPRVILIPAEGPEQPVNWLKPEKRFMPGISVHPAGTLAAVSEPAGLSLFDLASATLHARVEVQGEEEADRPAFSPDARQLAFVTVKHGASSKLTIWSGPDWPARALHVQPGPPGHVSTLAWSPDQRWIALGGDSGQIWLVPAAGGPPLLLGENLQWVRAIAFSPDGRWLFSASDDRSIHSWDLARVTAPEPEPESIARAAPATLSEPR